MSLLKGIIINVLNSILLYLNDLFKNDSILKREHSFCNSLTVNKIKTKYFLCNLQKFGIR